MELTDQNRFCQCRLAASLVLVLFFSVSSIAAEQPAWIAAMREVHARGSGEAGVVLNVGDSITYSMAYFAPLQYLEGDDLPAPVRSALATVDSHIKTECYRWKGADKGNQGSQTAAWALEHVDRWVETLNPEVVIIMFGTNDVAHGSVAKHQQNLRRLVQSLPLADGVRRGHRCGHQGESAVFDFDVCARPTTDAANGAAEREKRWRRGRCRLLTSIQRAWRLTGEKNATILKPPGSSAAVPVTLLP